MGPPQRDPPLQNPARGALTRIERRRDRIRFANSCNQSACGAFRRASFEHARRGPASRCTRDRAEPGKSSPIALAAHPARPGVSAATQSRRPLLAVMTFIDDNAAGLAPILLHLNGITQQSRSLMEAATRAPTEPTEREWNILSHSVTKCDMRKRR